VSGKNTPYQDSDLQNLSNALAADLVRFEKNLPKDAENLTEDFERYARVISLLICSMNLLVQREEKLRSKGSKITKPRQDILAELEHTFNRILAESPQKDISE